MLLSLFSNKQQRKTLFHSFLKEVQTVQSHEIPLIYGLEFALLKEWITHFVEIKERKEQFDLFPLFHSFGKEQESESLFVALFLKSGRAKNESAKERLPNPELKQVKGKQREEKQVGEKEKEVKQRGEKQKEEKERK